MLTSAAGLFSESVELPGSGQDPQSLHRQQQHAGGLHWHSVLPALPFSLRGFVPRCAFGTFIFGGGWEGEEVVYSHSRLCWGGGEMEEERIVAVFFPLFLGWVEGC